MDFEELVEIFGVFKKLHTSNVPKDKIIFYRDVRNMKGLMKIVKFDGTVDEFKLNLISHMSLSSYDGLLIQYDSLDGRRMFPYRLINIKDISIELQ